MINCLLCMKINIYRTAIWCSWSRNASYYQNIRMIKNLFIRSKISNNHQVRLQEFTVFYDDKKIEWMTSMMNKNSSRIWFCYSILQRKKQQLNRHFKQKIRFYQKEKWKTRTNNAVSKSKQIIKIHTLQNYLNRRIFEWTN